MRIATYADVRERDRSRSDTFGSGEWLWDTPDEVRFDPVGQGRVGAERRLTSFVADGADADRVPVVPAVRPGGLRADEVRDFRLEATTELCRGPGDAVLTCLRDLDVLDEPLEARIGIAPAPDPCAPAPATRRLFTECLDLVTVPPVDEVTDRGPAALARLRAVHADLRAQREDRHRVDALPALIGDPAEDYAGR
ncbi:hypothetical protein ACGFYY_11905 [Streptomyces sp. NPDC048331]|uniref:hypothetical protein n=1 Tax=Streptomyces sp. NPDC048331 TaxID=3365534 RepID=UPI00372327E2